jgi:asparagine synthetase B (glutamine-hydrolysing)
MCGLFGFIGRSAQGEVIRKLAFLASQRGPDSWGVFSRGRWWDKLRQSGKLDPAEIGVEDKQLVIGHCRLATSGALGAIQPITCGEVVIAHNGNFYDAIRFRPAFFPRLKTDCDSEVLGLAIDAESRKASLLRSVVSVMAKRLNCSPTAFLVARRRRLVAFSQGLPLFQLRRQEGTYFCSLQVDDAAPILGAKEFSL